MYNFLFVNGEFQGKFLIGPGKIILFRQTGMTSEIHYDITQMDFSIPIYDQLSILQSSYMIQSIIRVSISS